MASLSNPNIDYFVIAIEDDPSGEIVCRVRTVVEAAYISYIIDH